MYKILDLARGRYYNGVLSTDDFNFPDVEFKTLEDAQLQLHKIFYTFKILRDRSIKEEHFEIVEVEE